MTITWDYEDTPESLPHLERIVDGRGVGIAFTWSVPPSMAVERVTEIAIDLTTIDSGSLSPPLTQSEATIHLGYDPATKRLDRIEYFRFS